jgi:NAD(P)-dependent dehydrogenase (short-subunit alcohol dehydrogenase family)
MEVLGKFAGKVILITGASSGIGLATAQKFAALGATLSLLGRNVEALSKLEAQLKSVYKVQACSHRCDVTNQVDVDQAVTATVSEFGRLDVLINSAGVLHAATAQATTPEIFDLNFSTNTRGPFLLMHACIPHLEISKGCIVNVSSVNGMQSFAGTMAYCASKVRPPPNTSVCTQGCLYENQILFEVALV